MNEESGFKIVTTNWNIQWSVKRKLWRKKQNYIIWFHPYDYKDACILLRGGIITIGHNKPTPLAFKKCASFIKCIAKINEKIADDAEDLELVMLAYN